MPTPLAVRPPAGTPEWEPLFLAGEGAALGDWSPRGVALHRGDDGLHRAEVDAPPGTPFLVTRGSWRVVESDGSRRERPPRNLPAGPEEVAVAGWGRDAVHYHHDFRPARLEHARAVTVALPPGYDGQRRFPTFYLHDGQNLFDAATSFAGTAWGCDESAETAARAGRCEPVILVGVANSPERLREYGPLRAGGDLAGEYARFLLDEVKPFVDRTYATRPGAPDTAVGGSSLGGLISLHLAKWHPEAFGKCAAISPSLWWDRDAFIAELDADAAWLARVKLWLDTGGREGSTRVTQVAGLRRARRFTRLLRPRSPEGQFHYGEYPHGEHNEWHWGRRFGAVVEYLFPPTP